MRQLFGKRRQRSGVWAVAGREGVQHTDGNVGGRLGHRDSGPILEPIIRPRPTGVRTLLSDRDAVLQRFSVSE